MPVISNCLTNAFAPDARSYHDKIITHKAMLRHEMHRCTMCTSRVKCILKNSLTLWSIYYYFNSVFHTLLFQICRPYIIISTVSSTHYYFNSAVHTSLFQLCRSHIIISTLSSIHYYFNSAVHTLLFLLYRRQIIISTLSSLNY